jgi:hypothetical protein
MRTSERKDYTMKIAMTGLLVAAVLLTGCGKDWAKRQAKKATDKGAAVVEGIGAGLAENGNKAGKTLGEGLGAVFSGIGEGVEKSVTARDVRISDELVTKGVSVTVTKHTAGTATNQWQHGLSLYVVNKDAVAGTLRIKLFNGSTQEIGRATAPVTLPADDAKYIQFLLDKEIPVLMAKFIELDLKKE